MRVTFALPCYPWEPMGGFRVVYEYANHLAKRGHEISVVHARRLHNAPPPPPANPYRWLRQTGTGLRDWFLKPDIHWQPIDQRVQLLYVPDLISRYVPESDAIFATHWSTAKCVLELPKGKGAKFYLVQDFYPWFGSREALEETWAWPLNKVTVSNWLCRMVRSSPSVGGSVAAVPIGIDHGRFRLKNDIEARTRQVAIMCSSAPYKASDEGLIALREVASRHPEIKLVCFGPRRLRRSDLPAWATCLWNIPESELVDLYNTSSIYVCSSAAEGFALPPAEAMACGCAIASTDCGGNREYAEAGVTALLSPPTDPASLAGNVIRLLENDDLRVQIAIEGHKRIQAFTWERSTDRLEAYIKDYVRNAEAANHNVILSNRSLAKQ